MHVQNVTISLPDDLIREAKHAAVDQGISLSRLVALALEQRVRGVRAYHEARERHLRILGQGFDLGTAGQVTWKRDDLHER